VARASALSDSTRPTARLSALPDAALTITSLAASSLLTHALARTELART
jgi:hypothetical protein